MSALLKDEENIPKTSESEDKDLPYLLQKGSNMPDQLKALLAGTTMQSSSHGPVPRVPINNLSSNNDPTAVPAPHSRRMSVRSNMSRVSEQGQPQSKPHIPVPPLSPKNASTTPPHQSKNPGSNTGTQSHKLGKATSRHLEKLKSVRRGCVATQVIGAMQSFQQFANANGQLTDKPPKGTSPAHTVVMKSAGNFDQQFKRTFSRISDRQPGMNDGTAEPATPHSHIAEEDANEAIQSKTQPYRAARDTVLATSEQRADVLAFVGFFRIFVEKYYLSQCQALRLWVWSRDTIDEMVIRKRLRGVNSTRHEMLAQIEAEKLRRVQEGLNRVKEEFGLFRLQIDLNKGARITSHGLTKVWLSHVDHHQVVLAVEVPNGARALFPIECTVYQAQASKHSRSSELRRREQSEQELVYYFPWKEVVLKIKSMLVYDLQDPVFAKSIKVVLGYPVAWDDLLVYVGESSEVRRHSIASNRHQVVLFFEYLTRLLLTRCVVVLGQQPRIELATHIRERLGLDSRFSDAPIHDSRKKYLKQLLTLWTSTYQLALAAIPGNQPQSDITSRRFIIPGGASRPDSGMMVQGSKIPSMRLNLNAVPDESSIFSQSAHKVPIHLTPSPNRLGNDQYDIDDYYLNQIDADTDRQDPGASGMVNTGLSMQSIGGTEVICLRRMSLPVLKTKLAVLTWKVGENLTQPGTYASEKVSMLSLKIRRGMELSFYSRATQGELSVGRAAQNLEASIYLFENQDVLHVDTAFLERICRIFPKLEEEEADFLPSAVLADILSDPIALTELRQLTEQTQYLRSELFRKGLAKPKQQSLIRTKLPTLRLYGLVVGMVQQMQPKMTPRKSNMKTSPRALKQPSPRFGSSKVITVSEPSTDPQKALPGEDGAELPSSRSRKSSSVIYSSRQNIQPSMEAIAPQPKAETPPNKPVKTTNLPASPRNQSSALKTKSPKRPAVSQRAVRLAVETGPDFASFDYLLSPYGNFPTADSLIFPADFRIPPFEACMQYFATHLRPPRMFLHLLKYSIAHQVQAITASTIRLDSPENPLRELPVKPLPPTVPTAIPLTPRHAAAFRDTVKKLDNDIRNFGSGVFLQFYNTVKRVGERAKFYLRVRYQNKDYIVKIKYTESRGQKQKVADQHPHLLFKIVELCVVGGETSQPPILRPSLQQQLPRRRRASLRWSWCWTSTPMTTRNG